MLSSLLAFSLTFGASAGAHFLAVFGVEMVLTTDHTLELAVAQQSSFPSSSSVSVVCIAGQCLEGSSNTTSASYRLSVPFLLDN